MIPESYSAVKARFVMVRSVLKDMVDDPNANRCAAVIGGALRLHPLPNQLNFSMSPDLKGALKNQPFVKKYFLKAEELAGSIKNKFGPADNDFRSAAASSVKILPPGVIYLKHCWPTPREKLINLGDNLFHGGASVWGTLHSGDHIDLWDGKTMEIERMEPGGGFALVTRAQEVLFWRLN